MFQRMHKVLIVFLGLVFVLGLVALSSPKLLVAKEKKPYVFITYTGKSPKVKGCQITTNDQVNIFGVVGWRLVPGLTDYKLNYATKPRNWSDESFKSGVELAFSNIQGAGGGILFRYAGESNVSKAM